MAVSSVFSGNLWRQAAKDFHDLTFFVIFRTDVKKLIFLVIYSKVVHLTDQNDRPVKRFSGQMVTLAGNSSYRGFELLRVIWGKSMIMVRFSARFELARVRIIGSRLYVLTNFYQLACEQALLFGRVKRVSRERASERRSREGRVLARLTSLAQIGELARRLFTSGRTYSVFCMIS